MASWLVRVLSRQLRGMSTSSTFRSRANVTRKPRSPPLPRSGRLYSQANVSQIFRPRSPRLPQSTWPQRETPLWYKIQTVMLFVAIPFQLEGFKQYSKRWSKWLHEFDLESWISVEEASEEHGSVSFLNVV